MSAFADLSQILVVIVGGSIEDERLFSAASIVLSKHRRRLDKSLDKCMREKVQSVFNLDKLPYTEALNASPHKHGRYIGKRK